MAARNADVAAGRLEFRIGINLGDIISDDNDIYGDGVNVAARLEALAEPGGICVPVPVHDQVRDKLDVAFDDRGEQQVKNIARPVHVYRIGPKGLCPLDLPSPASEGGVRRAAGTEGWALPLPSPRSRCCRSRTCRATPSRNISPTASSRTSPPRSRGCRGSSSSRAIRASPTRASAVDVKQVGRELGVRYVLEGSVRKAGNRVRITGQLIDTVTGAYLGRPLRRRPRRHLRIAGPGGEQRRRRDRAEAAPRRSSDGREADRKPRCL